MFFSPAAQEAPCLCLEGDDDDGQFEVSLFLQLSQNSRPEEHLTLTNAIQVGVQFQMFYLETTGGVLRDELSSGCVVGNRFAYHQRAGLFPIHEAFGDGAGSQDLVPGNKTTALVVFL